MKGPMVLTGEDVRSRKGERGIFKLENGSNHDIKGRREGERPSCLRKAALSS